MSGNNRRVVVCSSNTGAGEAPDHGTDGRDKNSPQQPPLIMVLLCAVHVYSTLLHKLDHIFFPAETSIDLDLKYL
jgi:hypothetical protein